MSLLLLRLLFAFLLTTQMLEYTTGTHRHHRGPFETVQDFDLFQMELRPKKSDDLSDSQNCKSVQTEIQVSKEDKSSNGEVVRVCEGVVKVTKCEGACLSRLRPWINSSSGFLKECKCCREGSMSQKSLTLEICFDADGNRLSGQSMEIAISQPIDCSCAKCS